MTAHFRARAAFQPRIHNSHRSDDWKRCPAFLKWLRGRECYLVRTGGCVGRICAAHFDPWGDKGMSTKVSDWASLPLCDGIGSHHEEQHRMGWPAFQKKYGFDGRDIVTAYWLEWLDHTPMGRSWARRAATCVVQDETPTRSLARSNPQKHVRTSPNE